MPATAASKSKPKSLGRSRPSSPQHHPSQDSDAYFEGLDSIHGSDVEEAEAVLAKAGPPVKSSKGAHQNSTTPSFDSAPAGPSLDDVPHEVSKRRSPRNKLNANPPALPDPLAEFIGPAPREESGTDGSDGYQQDSDDEPDAEPMDVEDDSEVEDELVKAAKQARRPSSSKVKAGNSKQAPSSKPLRKKRAKAADEDKENLPKAKKLKVDKGKGKAAVPPSDSTPGNVESTLGPPGFIPVPPLQPGPSAAALVASTSLPFVFTVLPATTAQPAEPGAKTLASKTNAKAVREANKTKLDSRKRITDHAARKLLEGSKTVIENAISMQAKADGTLLCYGIAFEGERAQTAKSIEKASLGVAEAVDKLSNLLDKLRLPGEVSATKLSLSSAIADKIVDKISADIATIAGLVVSAQTATVVPDSEDDLAGTSS